MDVYFKFKIYAEYIIPALLIGVLLVVIGICEVVHIVKESRINKFFLSHGYERKLLGVPSVGGGAFYGWVRESDHKIADDRDIRGWTLKEIKKKYK